MREDADGAGDVEGEPPLMPTAEEEEEADEMAEFAPSEGTATETTRA